MSSWGNLKRLNSIAGVLCSFKAGILLLFPGEKSQCEESSIARFCPWHGRHAMLYYISYYSILIYICNTTYKLFKYYKYYLYIFSSHSVPTILTIVCQPSLDNLRIRRKLEITIVGQLTSIKSPADNHETLYLTEDARSDNRNYLRQLELAQSRYQQILSIIFAWFWTSPSWEMSRHLEKRFCKLIISSLSAALSW